MKLKFRIHYLLLLSLVIMLPGRLFSFCEHTEKKKCLKFNEFISYELKDVKIIDFTLDKDANQYSLLNKKDKFYINKTDKNHKLIWSKEFKGSAVNIMINSKNEVIISSYFTGDILLESKKYNSNTKSLALLKLDNLKGELKNHLVVSTSYGVIPIVAKLSGDDIFIAGYYSGKSKFLNNTKKIPYEDGFLLALDENFNKKWTKTFFRQGFSYISDFKIGNENIYLMIKFKNNILSHILHLDKKTKLINSVTIKENNVISFDIDEKENIYLINKKRILKKFNKSLKEIASKDLNEFDFSFSPLEIIYKNGSLFIQYISVINYKKNILLSNYDLNLKNIWYYTITGQINIKSTLKLLNNNLFLIGEFWGNMIFEDKDYFSNKNTSFVLIYDL